MKKKLLVLFSVLVFSLFFFLVKSEKTGTINIKPEGDSYFEGLKIINRKNGVQEWVLIAKRADLSKNGKEANLKDITMMIEKQGMTVSADTAVYNMESKKVFVDGNLSARSDNYSLSSSRALIDSTAGIMETDADVEITGKKFHLKGKGMQTDNKADKVRIKKNVKATFNR